MPEDSPAAGVTVKALEELGEGETEVITLIRGGTRRYEPAGNVVLNPATFSSCKESRRRLNASSLWKS